MSDYNDTCLDIELLKVDTKQTMNFLNLKKHGENDKHKLRFKLL